MISVKKKTSLFLLYSLYFKAKSKEHGGLVVVIMMAFLYLKEFFHGVLSNIELHFCCLLLDEVQTQTCSKTTELLSRFVLLLTYFIIMFKRWYSPKHYILNYSAMKTYLLFPDLINLFVFF